MKFEDFTKNQQAAITADGGVLVTASAGSGKTSVLVQRVMDKILNKGVPIDRLLIVTFTNAAAAEMRERIEKSLAHAQAEKPDSRLIAMQKQRLASAKICTVDSFCIDLVRENFDALGIMPDFKIVDPSSVEGLQNQALSEVLEPMFEENSPEFRVLLQSTGDSYGDDRLKEYIKRIYDYVTNMPFYVDWLKYWDNYYTEHDCFEGTVWDDILLCEAEDEFLRIKSIVNDSLFVEEIDDPKNEVYKNTLISMQEEIKRLHLLCTKRDSKALCEAILNAKSFMYDQKRSLCARAVANSVKEFNGLIDKIAEWYDGTAVKLCERYKFTADISRMLIDLVLQFDKRFYELMSDANSLTFAQTEQLALKLLCENTAEGIAATVRGKDIADGYDEIIVDEYQDTNDLQDALVQALSNDGQKLFVVGDAKQSIYEFRGTNPVNFINKTDAGQLQKIALLDNFRSSKNVCGFINKVFENLMTVQNSKIEYKEQKLIPFDKSEDKSVFINFHSTKGCNADAAAENEAALIACYINSVIKEQKDNLDYSDFTVLMRGNNRMEIYANTLNRYGVPAYCNRSDFLQKREVQLTLSLLSVIDNPTKDAQLLAVMMSALFGFDADSLAILRHEYPAPSIWASVICAAQNGDKACAGLCERIKEYRRLCLVNKLPDFMAVLFDITGLEDIARAMPNGAQRVKNLRILQSMAAEYDKNNDRGIAGFIANVEQGQSSQQSAPESVNAVKITTMHSSKGLEFPVCIIAGAAAAFGGKRTSGFGIKNTLGIACDAVGETLAQKIISPAKAAIDIKNSNDNIAEELRLMYVFMTRAKKRLAIFAGYSDLEKKLKEIRQTVRNNGGMPDAKRASCYMDCILQSIAADNENAIDRLENITCGGVEIIDNAEYRVHCEIPLATAENINVQEKPDENETQAAVMQLEQNLAFKYPFEHETQIPAKMSVSELTHQSSGTEYSFTKKPAFLSKNQLTPAQRGIATHMFMQFCDMQKAALDSQLELERLVEYQFITEQQAAAVDMSAIKAFFASPLYERISNANNVYREIRFLTKIYPDGDESTEGTVLQGVADCVFEENGSLVILDFKTDRVNTQQQLVDMYKQQLQLYAQACQKTFNMPVRECVIYSFVLKKAIKL